MRVCKVSSEPVGEMPSLARNSGNWVYMAIKRERPLTNSFTNVPTLNTEHRWLLTRIMYNTLTTGQSQRSQTWHRGCVCYRVRSIDHFTRSTGEGIGTTVPSLWSGTFIHNAIEKRREIDAPVADGEWVDRPWQNYSIIFIFDQIRIFLCVHFWSVIIKKHLR